MRELLNKFGYLIAAALVLLTLGLFIRQFFFTKPKTGGNPSMRWFIDEATGEESLRPANELPPLPNKDGKRSIVMEMKITTDHGKTVQTLYLLKYSDEALAKAAALPPDDLQRPDVLMAGELVRSPEPGSKWFPPHTPEADSLRTLPPGANFAWPP